ncbi:hypothetical protein MUS1_11680 [Marinomonas ushuaiensis DSM 15871]|uniref:Uncharacterized protein n=1 Tax=Marinomonas ushuaiensis DSM 15871 TaxID=1122207 RepID=X7E5C6_9GAMM|nr:hypothetical protein [Marinomonas ushuaiensis]ETX11162.1 hypothetical protein MUS1_11680 [Marinomonas ushuaiensis DSM 15871]
MTFLLSTSQRGWVSLPIIALLLAVSALSVRYQEDVLAAYQWRGQLSDVEDAQQIWTAFKSEFITAPDFSAAHDSECVGFCDLFTDQSNGHENAWRFDNQDVSYQWSRFELTVGESADLSVSYRLCATQNQQDYLCWWWREGKLISNGWVSIINS